jgi:tRNA (guanine-N7-)-methyltransferase
MRKKSGQGDSIDSIRPVRSYVLRGGRLTEGQKRALDELWPDYGIDESESPLKFRGLFGNDAPIVLEIGFGDGEATWRMASQHPEQNFIGVEVHRPGVGHLLLALAEHGLGNVRVSCTDAVDFLQKQVPADSLDGVRIYFPDPWPKKRHHKRRIIQPAFVDLLAARMRAGAVLHLATDWTEYADYMTAVLGASAKFRSTVAPGAYSPRPEWRPRTKYERRGERLGHPVYDLVYVRTR